MDTGTERGWGERRGAALFVVPGNISCVKGVQGGDDLKLAVSLPLNLELSFGAILNILQMFGRWL